MAETYRVTAQRQTSTLANGTFVPAMEVTFETTSGVVGTVVVPVTAYSPDNVAKAITERVDAIEAVSQL